MNSAQYLVISLLLFTWLLGWDELVPGMNSSQYLVISLLPIYMALG